MPGTAKFAALAATRTQTVALDIVRRSKTTPVHELERYMRCKDCSQVRGYAYKRSHLAFAFFGWASAADAQTKVQSFERTALSDARDKDDPSDYGEVKLARDGSRIYSILENGSRVATLELTSRRTQHNRPKRVGQHSRYQVGQLVGARNSRPAPEVVKAVGTFVEEINNHARVATMVGAVG